MIMIYIRKRVSFILLAFAISLATIAQSSNEVFKKIAPSLLRQDFLLLKDTLQRSHPGLYRYHSKSTMDHIFDSCLATLQDSMDVTGFYTLTRYIIASVKDGHSNCKLPD